MENQPPVEAKPRNNEFARDWSEVFAFGLPTGSIRAILAILVLGTAAGLTAVRPNAPLPDYLRDLMFLILGHYFALRRTQSEPALMGPPPLFLPRGSIRLIILLGYVAVVFIVLRGGVVARPSASPSAFAMLLVGGFLLGVLTSKIVHWLNRHRTTRPHRFFSDVRAVIVLLAAVVLVTLAWNTAFHFLPTPKPAAELPGRVHMALGDYGLEHWFGALIGFYFGSRS